MLIKSGNDITIYLDEQQVDNLNKAAVMADDHSHVNSQKLFVFSQ